MDSRGGFLVIAWGDPNGGAGAAGLAIAASLAGAVADDVEIRCCERIGPELIADAASADRSAWSSAALHAPRASAPTASSPIRRPRRRRSRCSGRPDVGVIGRV